MDRDIPTFNQLVVNKIQQKNLQAHYQRLHNIKSQHSRLYSGSSHNSRYNRKAHQQQEDRQTQIQKNNVMLFNKMVKIMKRNDPCNQPTQSQTRNNGRPSTDLSRISEQNRTMYERLERQKPTIDHKKLQEQRKKQENILKFLGKYSVHSLQNTQNNSFRSAQVDRISVKGKNTKLTHYLQKPEATSAAIDLRPQRYYQYHHPDLEQEIDEREIQAHIDNINRAKKVYSSTHETSSRRPDSVSKAQQLLIRKEMKPIFQPPQPVKDIILFKTRQISSGQIWDINIVRCHQSYEIRASTSFNNQIIQQKIEMTQMQGNQLLELTNYNYKEIVARLSITEENISFNQEKGGEGDDMEENQQPAYLGVNEDTPIPIPRKPQHYFNPSHISEQNEEESFRPADTFQQGRSPPKNQKKLDSLGPQEGEELLQINFEEEDNLDYCQEKGEKEEKSEVFKKMEKEPDVGPAIEETNKVVVISERPQLEITFNPPVQINHYEEALDEEIL